ncbi:hypothetical protein BDZ97DRAFT_1669429 [Flammula alnicola]|nr:hypothetical protein BDZ97DRAFT_1669429 [Flammula alnicola]
MRPPIPRKFDSALTLSPKSYTPIKGSDRPHHLSKPKKDRPVVYLADGITLTQASGLPSLSGQIGFAGDRPQDKRPRPSPVESEEQDDYQEPSLGGLAFMSSLAGPRSPENSSSRYRRRRDNQTQRWLLNVIPKLILPYMKLVNDTQSLRLDVEPISAPFRCSCGGESKRTLSVTIVQFHIIESITIQVCRCHPASRQLLSRGVFPCAPLAPTLAVDIRVLEFVSRLFLNIAPNTTAWCKTVEGFLESQGYRLSMKDSLRKRFGEALRWFNMLQDYTNQHINNVLYHTRQLGTEYNDGCHASTPLNTHSTSATSPADDVSDVEDTPRVQAHPNTPSTPNTQSRKRRASVEEEEEEECENPFPDPPPRTRPSDYLRSRCPLCFGGKFPRPSESKGPDIIVCMDACFKQKRNAGDKDLPREHPETVFVSETSTRHMEEYIETVHPSQSSARSKPVKRPRKDATTSAQEPEDGFDGPMQVPRSVLATCQESFYAADEHRQKASTQFFSETALMALLCRHDRVLWIVSMNSAGEKQYYTLVLLEMLFQNIPSTFVVGLLYDIGCQLHQSCIKWGFLDRYLLRLMFAISVFHAFGHQWACQIIYHPRKCIGFGLSDGEGCKRLWKSLQILIPYLRVCGHYQRLYTLDRQILHAERESLRHFGHWLLRRTRHCHEKRLEAEQILEECGQEIALLRREWDNQVVSQTKPLPRQSKHKGRDAVQKAMRLRKARDILKGQVHKLEDVISDDLSEDYAIAEAELRLPEVRERFEKAAAQVKAAENGLGVDERAKLKQLANNPFISTRMNTRALKIRLRERLRSRKFELDRLERSFRHQVNNQKIDQHTENSVKQRDPSIQKLARDYNKLCKVMSNLKAQRKAPRGAVCPEEIDMSGLFALDVDDDIWQDIGLDDTLDNPHASVAPPLWLSDDNVRSSIKAMLELDRCIEEEDRLAWERSSLQFWFAEEWDVVSMAYNATDAGELRYQLQLCKDELLSLLVGWHKTLQSVVPGTGDLLPEWGPTEDEIMNARITEVTAHTIERSSDSYFSNNQGDADDDSDSVIASDDEVIEIDSALIDTLEAVDLADAFRQNHFI